MAMQSKTQDSITSHVKYTWKEMKQMASAWSKLAGAFGHSTTREVHEIYRKLPENQASRDLIDQYFHVRHNETYGWRATANENFVPDTSRSIYNWLTDDLIFETLGRPEKPKRFGDSGFPETERTTKHADSLVRMSAHETAASNV
ncbi:hypothetical protein F1880_000664 [Penicillium rolfsii]|nr:hypothetical protein F1880_000664 [Penicillium rolfsii]